MDLTIPQGVDWAVYWPILNADESEIDFTGWKLWSQVRRDANSRIVLHEWSMDAGNVTLEDGRATLHVPSTVSSDWTWSSGVYDVKLISPDGQVQRIDKGSIRVDPEVTK